MSVRRRDVIGMLGGAAAWPLAARAQVSAPINWNLPSAYPVNNFHSENLGAFAKDLAEATGGKLTIKVYPQCIVVSRDGDQKRGADRAGPGG